GALVPEAAAGHRVDDVGTDLAGLDGGLEAGVFAAHDPEHRVEVGLLRAELDEHVAGDRADAVDIFGPAAATPALGTRAAAERAADHDVLAGWEIDRILARTAAGFDRHAPRLLRAGRAGRLVRRDAAVDADRRVLGVGAQATADQAGRETEQGQAGP